MVKYFTKQDLLGNTPSRKDGLSVKDERLLREHTANLIQNVGQHLRVSRSIVNTAIVFMQSFYMVHSFKTYCKYKVATAVLYLAAKVENEPRLAKHVIQVSHYCLHKLQNMPPYPLYEHSHEYLVKLRTLEGLETVILDALDFQINVEDIHEWVLEICQLLKASDDFVRMAVIIATYSFHYTTLCVQYPSVTVACGIIHCSCRLTHFKFPLTDEGEEWFHARGDKTIALELLEELADELQELLTKIRELLKKRKPSVNQGGQSGNSESEQHEQCMLSAPEENSGSHQEKKRQVSADSDKSPPSKRFKS